MRVPKAIPKPIELAINPKTFTDRTFVWVFNISPFDPTDRSVRIISKVDAKIFSGTTFRPRSKIVSSVDAEVESLVTSHDVELSDVTLASHKDSFKIFWNASFINLLILNFYVVGRDSWVHFTLSYFLENFSSSFDHKLDYRKNSKIHSSNDNIVLNQKWL